MLLPNRSWIATPNTGHTHAHVMAGLASHLIWPTKLYRTQDTTQTHKCYIQTPHSLPRQFLLK